MDNIKVVLAFSACVFVLALISMKVPLFVKPYRYEDWKKKNPLQRFSIAFFVPVIGFVVALLINGYKQNNSPSSFERMLISGEWEYCMIIDGREEHQTNTIYEVRAGLKPEDICLLIAKICTELEKGEAISVTFVEDKYVIADQNGAVGTVIYSDEKYGTFLYFYFK